MVKLFRKLYYAVLLFASIALVQSCSTIKDYPVRKPFVYHTNITIAGKFSTDEKKQLTEQLNQQLHDSIQVRRVQKLIFWHTLKKPPVYDSLNSDKSVAFMNALLNALGYYRDSITYKASIDTVEDQYRTTVSFFVAPGTLVHLDSIAYTLTDSTQPDPLRDTLQKLTIDNLDKAVIKKGDPFSKPQISNEFDRLSDLYRNNGYLRFTRENLLAIWDTVGLNLLRPTLDPIEQAQLLEQLRIRRENPKADLTIRLRPETDTNQYKRYYIGRVTVYPDFIIDTAGITPTVETINGIRFISYQRLFRPKKLYDFIYLQHGELYRQSNYLKTVNRFNALSSWRLVNINQFPRTNQDTADFDIRLSPARKYAATANLEGSLNQGNYLFESNLLGIGVTFGLQNRNFAKAADQASTNLRLNTELNANAGQNIFQTRQIMLNHTIDFPRFVPRIFKPIDSTKRYSYFKEKLNQLSENTRTIFALNAGLTDRIDYYKILTLNTSWGYEYSNKNNLYDIRFPNIEYNFLTRRDSLLRLISRNKTYKYIFNNGLILSTILNRRVAGGKTNKTVNLANFGLEFSGILASLLHSKFLDSNLYRFIKVDAEFRQTIFLDKLKRHSFAWRVFGGAGFGLPHNNKDSLNFYIPFFRQYYAGGPNSMRAWGIRKLGPGSSVKSFAATDAPDRFGDMRLEANAEYRFYLLTLNGVALNGAVFTDVGNVWFLRDNPDFPGGTFHLNNLWHDLAIGSGAGLRIDFGFFKLRFDYAYKVKDPSPDITHSEGQNVWFYNWKPLNGQFQLGIDYPF